MPMIPFGASARLTLASLLSDSESMRRWIARRRLDESSKRENLRHDRMEWARATKRGTYLPGPPGAGRVLAEALAAYRGRHDVLVLALARGGVPVGWEVAAALSAPLDVFLVRKLGVPHWEEL